jgi:hypothetical protein
VSPLCSAAATALRGLAKRTCRKFLDFFFIFQFKCTHIWKFLTPLDFINLEVLLRSF